MEGEQQRHNDQAILQELKDLRKDIVDMREEMNTRLAPIDNLKGFWKVIGFVCGGVALLGGGLAGAKYLSGIFHIAK